MEHRTPGTGPLRCLSLGRDAGTGQSYTHPVEGVRPLGPLHVRLLCMITCAHVCAVGARGVVQTCVDESLRLAAGTASGSQAGMGPPGGP